MTSHTLPANVSTYFVSAKYNQWMFDMANQSKEIIKARSASSVNAPRRRTTDRPPPLDQVTRELVREIIEIQQRPAPPPKSFMQKWLKVD